MAHALWRSLVTQLHPASPLSAVGSRLLHHGTHKSAHESDPAYSRPSGYSLVHSTEPFQLQMGGTLNNLKIAYEMWGRINEARSNVILLHAGLSASSHAKSHPLNPQRGWWEDFIGPGRALDTNLYAIICCNNLGSCFGSTGPSSEQSDGQPFGLRFPFVTVKDIVRSQFLVLDHLGVDRIHATVGSSLGGMQSLVAAATFPDRVSRLVTISAAARSNPMAIAMRFVQRRALMMDPDFNEGDYYSKLYPKAGMRLAREMATITYRSGEEWEERFGRERLPELQGRAPSLDCEYQVESYLSHQGRKWCDLYDPNSLLILSKAMDLFTMEEAPPEGSAEPSLAYGLRNVMMPTLVMGVRSDALFPFTQQREIVRTLRAIGNPYVVFYQLDAPHGHDTFLLDVNSVGAAVKGHLDTCDSLPPSDAT